MANQPTQSTQTDKRRDDLGKALDQITKDFGKGAIMRLGDAGASVNVDAIPTGALSLDIALGIGGVPSMSIPGTLVIDTEGRVAGWALGAADTNVLEDFTKSLLEEQ